MGDPCAGQVKLKGRADGISTINPRVLTVNLGAEPPTGSAENENIGLPNVGIGYPQAKQVSGKINRVFCVWTLENRLTYGRAPGNPGLDKRDSSTEILISLSGRACCQW